MSRIDTMSVNMDRRPFIHQTGDANSAKIESLSHHSQQLSLNQHQYRSNLHKSNTLTPADVKKLVNQNYGQRRAVRTASVLRKPKAPLPIKTTNFDGDQSSQNHRFSSMHLEFNSSRLSSTLPRNRTVISNSKSISPDPPASLSNLIPAPDHGYQNRLLPQKQLDSSNKLNLLKMTPLSSIKRFWKLMSRTPIDEKKQSSTGYCNTDSSRFSKSEDLRMDTNRLFLTSIGSIGGDSIDGSNATSMCPPPPDELKSVNYMTSNINYSNYDEFTRTRNQLSSTLLNHSHSQRRSTKQHLESNNYNINGMNNIDSANATTSYRTQFNNKHNNIDNLLNNNDNNSRAKSDLPQLISNAQNERESWQLCSLPVTYEKNLSTLYEERQHHSDSINDRTLTNDTSTNDFIYGFATRVLEPPKNFENSTIDNRGLLQHSNGVSDQTDSSQSLDSTNTSDSFIEQQKQNNTKFRFSYAQPNSFLQQQSKVSSKYHSSQHNSKLSDKLMRMSKEIAKESLDHIYDEAIRVNAAPLAHIGQKNNHSNPIEYNYNNNNNNDKNHIPPIHNLSTQKASDGLPPRVPGNCDQTRRISQDVGRDNSGLTNNNIVRSSSYRTSLCDNNLLKQKQQQFMATANNVGDGEVLNSAHDNNNSDDSPNTTIISNSSTIRPESSTNENGIITNTSNNNNHTNSILDIAELHKVIENLTRELDAKKKEINDLQLMKWKSEYINYQLKDTISKLEKENAQLKAIVVNSSES